jgi:hypothetical protein
MIRPATAFWIGLAGCIGFGLYHLKHEVQAQEDQLFRINRAILAEQEAIHVLHAEWNYMNQPARLQALASRHLDLQPMKPGQLGTLADLPRRPNDAAAPSAPLPPAPIAAAPSVSPALASAPGHGVN